MSTFLHLNTTYATRIADIIGASRTGRTTTPEEFIQLVEDAASSLRFSALEEHQEASEDLDTAADELRAATRSRGTDRDIHLARAETHICLALDHTG
ncbi:hypothetical protein AB0M64_19805 [Streptomyces sp. NPDC051771]|uniref:hypothetical protein n=1 Tax=Streptomyces sp. NPDC051771 TaxID=3154847 RepID=UPI0034365691